MIVRIISSCKLEHNICMRGILQKRVIDEMIRTIELLDFCLGYTLLVDGVIKAKENFLNTFTFLKEAINAN